MKFTHKEYHRYIFKVSTFYTFDERNDNLSDLLRIHGIVSILTLFLSLVYAYILFVSNINLQVTNVFNHFSNSKKPCSMKLENLHNTL